MSPAVKVRGLFPRGSDVEGQRDFGGRCDCQERD